MQKLNKNDDSNISFKIIIILLSFVLLCSLFYIYKMSDRSKSVIISLREEKSLILNDLEKSKLFLDQAINNKTTLNSKLAIEQKKVKKLITEIKNSNLSINQIYSLKKGVKNVNERVLILIKELNYYKKKSDSTNLILDKQISINDTLINNNEVLSQKVTEGSKLYYYGLETTAYKLRISGKKVETEKASRADFFNISFLVGENKLVNASNHVLYIQIKDGKNRVIGNKKRKKIGNKTLVFSIQTKIKYNNKTIRINQNLPVQNLNGGLYSVNIFDKSNLILHKNFNLR